MKNTLWALIVLMIISTIVFLLFQSLWSTIPVIIIGIILIAGIIDIKNRPPEIGILTRLNKKIWKSNGLPVILEEGYNWIFLRGIIYNILRISAERRIKKLDPQDVLTPDNVNIQIPISLEWNIDEENLVAFIEIGEDKKVDEHISDILEGGLREYSRNATEGPMGWKEMIGSNLKILDFLVKSLSPSEDTPPNDGFDHLEKIDDDIPTPILLDYFLNKTPSNGIVRKEWGDGRDNFSDPWDPIFDHNWSKLLDKINQLGKDINDLRDKTKNRRILLETIKKGNARIRIATSGAYLNRLTVGDVKPFGDIYLADIELQKEQKQGISETYEVEIDLRKAELLKLALVKNGVTNASFHDCYNAIMKWKNFKPGTGFFYEGSLGNVAGLGDLISGIMKGGKS